MTNRLELAVHAFASRVSLSFSVDETLLPRYVNLSTRFRELLPSVDMSPVCVCVCARTQQSKLKLSIVGKWHR